MHKLIQSIALTAIVFSPLTLISLTTSAFAHHTSSHVSTVATNTPKTSKAQMKKDKKSFINVPRKQRSATTNSI
jgi:hypothetical protein